jgi:hypothetical protein
VLKITPDGNWTYQPATTNFPLGIAFDANGYRYMSDALGNNVDRTSPADVTTHWITGLPGTTGLAFDSEGRLFVADVSGNINSYAPDGTHLPYAASGVGQIWDAAIRVSEPSTFGLMALGIGVLAIARRNRRQLRV